MQLVDWSVLSSLGSAAAAVLVVVMFLRHLHCERKSDDGRESERLDAFKEINDRNRDHANKCEERMADCIDRNTISGDRNTEMMGQALEVMRKINGAKL